MTKLNKIRVSMLAIAMVLMSITWSVAQSPATGMQSTKPKNPAAAELRNYQADPANPELSDMRLSLLKAKAELESRQAANTISQEELTSLTRRIGLLETKVKEMTPQASSTREVNAREKQVQTNQHDQIILQVKEHNSITREQFVQLDAADQKFVLLNSGKISNLVNATSEQMRTQQDGIFYIPASGFSSYSIEKQIHILNNPATYLITQEQITAPAAKTDRYDSEIKTHTISRAELNSYSPEKRQAIENSKEFVITE